MLVINVGESSFKGRILMSLRIPNEDTPLQEKLAKLANFIGNFGIFTALLIFFAQVQTQEIHRETERERQRESVCVCE